VTPMLMLMLPDSEQAREASAHQNAGTFAGRMTLETVECMKLSLDKGSF
jgi:hypothetical protein